MKRMALIDFTLENLDGSTKSVKAGETVGFDMSQLADLAEAKRVHSDVNDDRRAREEFERQAVRKDEASPVQRHKATKPGKSGDE